MRNHSRRLRKVEQQILSQPIAREVVEQAFAVFQKTGELPEDVRLAYAVVRRTKHGPAQTWADVVLEVQRSIREFVERKPRPEDAIWTRSTTKPCSAPGWCDGARAQRS